MSIYVIRAFIELREKIATNAAILKRLTEIDKTLLEDDTALRDIYEKLSHCFHRRPSRPVARFVFPPSSFAISHQAGRRPDSRRRRQRSIPGLRDLAVERRMIFRPWLALICRNQS